MNNPAESNSIWRRSTVVRFCRWLCSWRGIRRLLIVAAWMATVVALFYAEENWRGRRAWNDYRQHLPRAGAELEFNAFLPKAVPDDQNFAAIPLIQTWFEKKADDDPGRHWSDPYSRADGLVPAVKNKKEAAHRRFVDLVAWQRAFAAAGKDNNGQPVEPGPLDAASRAAAAPAVLQALATNETLFAQLRAASSRPFSVYPIKYNEEVPCAILLPHLVKVRSVSQRLQLKACAELALGQTDQALEDIELILRLADSVKEEPILISQLVRAATFNLATRPLWEGLAEHRWSGPQLEKLQARLGQFEFPKETRLALEGERAASVAMIDYVRAKGRISPVLGQGQDQSSNDGIADFLCRLVPSGWFRQEQVNYCLAYDKSLSGACNFEAGTVSPARFQANQAELDRWLGRGHRGGIGWLLHHQAAIRVLMPDWRKIIMRLTAAQTTVEEAGLACALEQARLAQGQYPEALEVTTGPGKSAPHDWVTGAAYRYHRTSDGGYKLYSVGWDGKDDGGDPGESASGGEQGDWLWECPGGR